MLTLILTLFLFQVPGEQTRGLKEPPPAQIVVQPTPDGFDVGIHWTELAAMCTVLSALYFVITKAVIGPMIDKKLQGFKLDMEKQYMNREVVMAHFILDENRMENVNNRLDEIWEMVRK
jgi:hypothetical protein